MAERGAEYLTTRELAELLRIKERKVYDLAASGSVPCSRATGKLLFPRDAIEAWISSHSSGPGSIALQRPSVFLGSHDPLLEWALRESRCGLATYLDGSLDGLQRFIDEEGVASGLHLFVPAEEEWNVPLVRERLGAAPVVLVQFAWRERGLVLRPGMGESITNVASLIGRRVVARQPEAGSQVLLEHLLERAGHGVADMTFTGPVRSESDAAVAILEDKADAAFGLMGLARQYRLEFVPIMKERFDLLVDRAAWFEPPMQALLRFCTGQPFADKARELGGYDVSGFGTVRFNGG